MASDAAPYPVRLSLVERARRFRDRTLSSPGFQRWAERFVFTRPIARARTRDLFSTLTGFVHTQIAFATVESGLLEALSGGARTADHLAERTGLPEDSVRALLDGATAIGLIEPRGEGHFGLGEQGAALMGNTGALAMLRHHQILYRDLADPLALLREPERETELSRYWAYAKSGAPDALKPEDVAAYSNLMAASQDFIADTVVDAYPVGRHSHVMDVGGGSGAFIAKTAARCPHTRFTLFDLPAVAETAHARFEDAGLADRAEAIGGDFFKDVLPKGADLITLVRIIHDHDDGPALNLLKAARAALPDHGRLLIAEPMAGGSHSAAAYFSMYLMAMRSGRPRTEDELTALLKAAGFAKTVPVKSANPLLVRLLFATTT